MKPLLYSIVKDKITKIPTTLDVVNFVKNVKFLLLFLQKLFSNIDDK